MTKNLEEVGAERPEVLTPKWWAAARDRVKEVADGPNPDIDRIIKVVLENEGRVPAALVTEFPVLAERKIAAGVENAVTSKSRSQA